MSDRIRKLLADYHRASDERNRLPESATPQQRFAADDAKALAEDRAASGMGVDVKELRRGSEIGVWRKGPDSRTKPGNVKYPTGRQPVTPLSPGGSVRRPKATDRTT